MTSIVETDQPFVVELESFSGPLDLLLNLIRAQEIDIADIPVAKIADQFLAAIDVHHHEPDLADWRRAFAEELRAAIRHTDAIDALAASRRAGLID